MDEIDYEAVCKEMEEWIQQEHKEMMQENLD